MPKIELSKHFDAKIGSLSRACQDCLDGNKTVLFITGVCPRHCYYCPISEEKWQKDDVYANEWKTSKWEDIKQEIKLCNSSGVGITGGDPLARLDRTVEFIQRLKKEFGKSFHIHLYTSLDLLTKQSLQKLFDAGLDEIRVHPYLEDEKLWQKIELLSGFGWEKTVEIPVIPDLKQNIKKLMDFCKGKIDFLNLNEFEMSHTNSEDLEKKGYRVKNSLSHGVKKSEEAAKELLEYAQTNVDYNVHYCSSQSKDKQMSKRIKKRAKNIVKPYDVETEEGTLIRGCLYFEELKPGFSYTKKIGLLEEQKKQEYLKILKQKKAELLKDLRLSNSSMHIDLLKLRIITSPRVVEKNFQKIKKLGLVPAIVEEYPTQDSLEVQVHFL